MRSVKRRYIIIAMLLITLLLSFFKCCEVRFTGYQSVMVEGEGTKEIEMARYVYEEKYASAVFTIATIMEIIFIFVAAKKRYIFLAFFVDCLKMFIPYVKKTVDSVLNSIGCMYSSQVIEYDFNLVFYLIVIIECSIAILYIWEFVSMWWHIRKLNTIE